MFPKKNQTCLRWLFERFWKSITKFIVICWCHWTYTHIVTFSGHVTISTNDTLTKLCIRTKCRGTIACLNQLCITPYRCRTVNKTLPEKMVHVKIGSYPLFMNKMPSDWHIGSNFFSIEWRWLVWTRSYRHFVSSMSTLLYSNHPKVFVFKFK